MTAFLSPPPVFRSWDNLGFPLVGGKLFTYAAGTTTPQATFVDSTQTTQNTNPIILNFRGECFLWLDPTLSYKFVLQDALGNLLWTQDNIPGSPFAIALSIIPAITNTYTLGTPSKTWSNAYFGPSSAPVFDPTTGNIGYYAPSSAEITAGVTPTNYAYPPGSYQRYGMDGTGVAGSDTGFANACKCNAEVFDSYVGGGTYLFNTGVTISGSYPLRIRGQTRWPGSSSGNSTGTKFVLGSVAGAGAAVLKFTGGPLYGIEITGIGFTFQSSTLGQIAIRAATEFRASIIERCAFFAQPNASNNTVGIQFDSTTLYTGALSIRDNFFDAVNIAIWMKAVCTTVKITNTEFLGYSTGVEVGNCIEMDSGVTSNPVITGNYFEGWYYGIYANGATDMVQIGNSYAVCTTSFYWTAANARGISIGEQLLSGAGIPVYSNTDAAANIILGGAGSFLGATPLATTRTYTEGNGTIARAFAMGYPQAVVYASGNFTASTGTWIPTSGNQATFLYSITGKTLTVWFQITGGALSGTPTNVNIAIPGGFTAAAAVTNGCAVDNNGSWSQSSCQVLANASVIQVFATPSGSGTFATSAAVEGQITFPVN